MRITFDGTTLRPGRTGVGYYTEHLLRHLALEAPDASITVLSNTTVETAAPLPAHVATRVAPSRLPRLAWMQAVAPRLLRHLRADVAHFTNGMVPLASPVPTVVTIHDMSLTLYPGFHPRRRVLLNRPLVNLAARRADAVITVSESAKVDIVRLYRLDPARVHVVHEAAAPGFRRVEAPSFLEAVRTRYGLADRFVLYVGTIEPRKNLPMLLEAFARERREGRLPHQLVCVGPYGWLSDDIGSRVERLGLREVVRFAGYVPFADLPAIYSQAEMFVFPSVYEGFGLPVIEAMSCGVPVVTGRVAALNEVTGDAVELVDPLDAQTLGAALVRLAESPDRRASLSAAGVARARQFSWSRAARETLRVYHQVLAAPIGSRAAEAAIAQP